MLDVVLRCSFKHKCKNCNVSNYKAWKLTIQTTTKTRKAKHDIKNMNCTSKTKGYNNSYKWMLKVENCLMLC